MARISLRAYNRDIEAMIDGGQIDEAFSHCRYILERFPKHIDTYRLMGKALLEAQRFGDAADVFHRVLSSIPDDFIAHLGMSIIREDESNLDAAIWHMERSLEVQPSNAAVQVELRRLYGLRDGHTPQKIQLTRGALARMSAKSNLYTQAIAELRTALSDDPQRPDLLVVLAEMYKQTGARMEAVETCNSLISKLPYCLVANRILAEILPETEHAEKAQEYKNRLAELDPYYAQLSPVAPTLEQVPDGAVTIERYGYPGQEYQTTQTAQPEWAATLGVNIDEDVDYEEETPDWLKDEAELVVSAAAQEKMVEESPEDQFVGSADESQSGEATAEEDLPDWIKSAGLFEDEQSETPPVDVEPHAESDGLEDTEESELPLENADQDDIVSKQDEETQQAEPLPAWMSEVDFSEEEQISTETPISITEEGPETADSDFGEGLAQDTEIETPDWLHEAMAESDEDEEKAGILAAGVAAAAIPAIFSDDDQEQELEEQVGGDLPEEDTELAAESEQLHSEQPDSELIEAIEDIALDDKEDMIEHEGMAGAGAAALAGAAFARENESEDEVSIDALVSGSDFEESDFLEEGPSAESKQRDADIPDWLQDLGEDISEASTPDEIAEYEEPNLENEVLPPISAQISDEEQPETLEEIPLSLEDSIVELAGEISEDEDLLASEFSDAIPDWLSEVSPESAPDLTEQEQGLLDEMPEIVRAEIPVWLRKMEQEHRAELAAAGELETAQELEFDSDITEITGEDVPSWLMSAMETELPGEPDAVSEVMDISEIISEVSPEEESVVEEGVSDELEMDQELVGEIEPSGALTAAVVAAEILSEDEDFDSTGKEIGLEEVVEEPDLETVDLVTIEIDEEDQEPGAELVPAEEIPLEGDTQPVAVGMKEEIVEEETLAEPEQAESPLQKSEFEEAESAVEELALPEGTEEAAPGFVEAEQLAPEDEDAAMAWLESLAAKQGAKEEELLTAPEDRLEEPPEWVKEETAVGEGIEEPEQEEKIDSAAAAALAGLAARALLSTEDQEGEEQPEVPELIESGSEWIPEIVEEIEEQPELEAEQEAPVADIETELSETFEGQIEPEVPEAMTEDLEITPEELQPEPYGEQIAESAVTASEITTEEIPDWLSGLAEEEEVEVEPTPSEWTPAMLVEEESAAEEIQESTVAKIDLNAASLSQLEKIPGIGFIHAQRILEYRQQVGSFKSLEELEKVHGLTTDMVNELENYLTVEVVVEEPAPISSHPDLQNAWTKINEGDIEDAVKQYTDLINRNEHLDEVIRDLQEALVKHPQEAYLYQTLGDAYMHSNMLDEALDAYNRAEDLIQ